MLEQRIQQQFFESADLQYECAESSARQVALAAAALLNCITAGGKVLLHGAGMAQGLARHVSSLLLGRLERERPPLAAVVLGQDGDVALAAHQVAVLAQPGDCLLLIEDPMASGAQAQALACVQAAHQRDAHVTVLTRARATWWGEHLQETDVLVSVPHERPPRVLEAQLLVLHALCDALDTQLLGEQEPS